MLGQLQEVLNTQNFLTYFIKIFQKSIFFIVEIQHIQANSGKYSNLPRVFTIQTKQET